MKKIGFSIRTYMCLSVFALCIVANKQLDAQTVRFSNNVEVGGVAVIGLGFNDYPEVDASKELGYDVGNGENFMTGISLGLQGFGNFPVFILKDLYVSPYLGYNVTVYSVAEDAAPLLSDTGGQITLHSLRYGLDFSYRFALGKAALAPTIAPILGIRLDSTIAGNTGNEDETVEYTAKQLGTYASLVVGGEFIWPLTARFKLPFRLKASLNLGSSPALTFDVYAEAGFMYSFPRR